MTLYRHIAVAIDFSDASKRALQKALAFKKDYQADLTIIAVVDTKSFGSVEAYDAKYAKQLMNDYETQLAEIQQQYATEFGDIYVLVKEGTPKKVLTNLEGVDLIVCGATGKSKPEQFMLGSISASIVRYSKIDVCVVR